MGDYYRPEIRGDMREKLKVGVACEIVAHNVGTTISMLASLDCLKEDGFSIDSCTVRMSENKGWAVFDPTTPSEPQTKG